MEPAPTRHGEGALRPWGRCPLIPPEDSSLSPLRRTHKREKRENRRTEYRKQGTTQPKKITSPTRKKYFSNQKDRKAHSCKPCKPCKPCKHRTWYGEGTELVRIRFRLTPFVLFCSNHHFSLFYFVLFCSSCSKTQMSGKSCTKPLNLRKIHKIGSNLHQNGS